MSLFCLDMLIYTAFLAIVLNAILIIGKVLVILEVKMESAQGIRDARLSTGVWLVIFVILIFLREMYPIMEAWRNR